MILAAMLAVAAAAVLLVAGVVRGDLTLVYGSIGACLVAAALLVAGVVRARPRARRPPRASGDAGPQGGPPGSGSDGV